MGTLIKWSPSVLGTGWPDNTPVKAGGPHTATSLEDVNNSSGLDQINAAIDWYGEVSPLNFSTSSKTDFLQLSNLHSRINSIRTNFYGLSSYSFTSLSGVFKELHIKEMRDALDFDIFRIPLTSRRLTKQALGNLDPDQTTSELYTDTLNDAPSKGGSSTTPRVGQGMDAAIQKRCTIFRTYAVYKPGTYFGTETPAPVSAYMEFAISDSNNSRGYTIEMYRSTTFRDITAGIGDLWEEDDIGDHNLNLDTFESSDTVANLLSDPTLSLSTSGLVTNNRSYFFAEDDDVSKNVPRDSPNDSDADEIVNEFSPLYIYITF